MDDIQISELKSKLDSINSDLRRMSNLASTKEIKSDSKLMESLQITGRRLAGDATDLALTLRQNQGTLSAYSGSVNSVVGSLNGFVSSFGVGGKIVAGVFTVVGGLINRFLNGTEEVLNSRSKLESHGSTIDTLPTQLLAHANATQLFHSKNIAEYTKALETLGTQSIYLASTTGKGVAEFNKLSNVSPDIIDNFARMGVGPSELREYFAQYIKIESSRIFSEYQGAERENKRAVAFSKNLLAMASLTGESTKEMQQRYLELHKDLQFNATIESMKRNGRTKQAEHIESVLNLASSIMGPESMDAIKDIMVNGNATLDTTKGIIFMTGGKILDIIHGVMTDETVDPAKAIEQILDSHSQSIKEYSPFLKYGQSDALSGIGLSAKIRKAVSMRQTGMSIEKIHQIADQTAQAGSKLKDTQVEQMYAEGKAGIVADMLSDRFSDATISTFSGLETILKYTVKAFAFGAGLFGKTEFADKLNDIFMEAPELKQKAEMAATRIPIVQHAIETQKDMVKSLETLRQNIVASKPRKDGSKVLKDLDVKIRDNRLLQIDERIRDAKNALAKAMLEELELEKTVKDTWKRYQETTVNITESTGKKSVMDVISKYESDGEYNAIAASKDMKKQLSPEEYSYAIDFLNNLSGKTIVEVMDFQKWLVRPGIPSAAIGRYQYIRRTLNEKVTAMEQRGLISRNDYFSPETQDKIMSYHLDQLGYSDYASGKKSKEAFQLAIGRVWYGIATKRGDVGEDDSGVRVDGQRRNKAGSGSYEETAAVLDRVRQIDIARDPSSLPKYKTGGIATVNDIELHGIEAVIPFKKSGIDVTVNTPALIKVDEKAWQLNIDKIKVAFDNIKPPPPKIIPSDKKIDFSPLLNQMNQMMHSIDKASIQLDSSAFYLNTALRNARR